MSRVEYFEVNADDVQRAIDFYQKVFEWKIRRWKEESDYWLMTTGEKSEMGIDGAIQKRTDSEARVTNYIGVKDIGDLSKRIVKAGGKITLPKSAVPGVGWMVLFKDTEGNLLGAMQEDPDAR